MRSLAGSSAKLLIHQFGHLEHRDLSLSTKDRLQFVVRVDHPPLFSVLQIVLLNVLPELFDDLRPWDRLIAHYLGENRRASPS